MTLADIKLKATHFFQNLGRGYQGASHDRNLRTWVYSRGKRTADEEILPDLQILRERSRDLYRNSTVGRGAIKTVVSNVIGSGLKLQANIDREFLGMGDEEAEAWEANVFLVSFSTDK